MSKFQSLYNTLESQLTESQLTEVVTEASPIGQSAPPAPVPAQGPQSVQPQTPAPQEVKEPQADVTSEGKKFLVELALKALSVDPDHITETDKDIFNTPITTDNADDMLKRIQSIVDLYG